jgi:hypothetical protein
MEKKMKVKILDSISSVYDKSEDCKLEPSFFDSADKELKMLSDYFQSTKPQALLIAMIFSLGFNGKRVDLDDLIRHFSCNPLKLLHYMDDFKSLTDRGIINRRLIGGLFGGRDMNEYFAINKMVSEAILQSKPLPTIDQETNKDIYEVLEEFYNIGLQRAEEEISTAELKCQTRQIITANKHFDLISKVDGFQFEILDSYLLLYLFWKTVSGNETTDLSTALDGIS